MDRLRRPPLDYHDRKGADRKEKTEMKCTQCWELLDLGRCRNAYCTTNKKKNFSLNYTWDEKLNPANWETGKYVDPNGSSSSSSKGNPLSSAMDKSSTSKESAFGAADFKPSDFKKDDNKKDSKSGSDNQKDGCLLM